MPIAVPAYSILLMTATHHVETHDVGMCPVVWPANAVASWGGRSARMERIVLRMVDVLRCVTMYVKVRYSQTKQAAKCAV